LLLKLGGYGFLRLLLPSFYASNFFFSPYIKTLCILSIVHASLTSARQVDLKRIVAYSSIAHMNFGILGLFSLNLVGIQGSLFLMLAHGIVSAALFFCIGVLYERYHSRNLFYYGGLVQTMPLFSFYFLLFSFANIGLPGTCNFIGELLIILGLVSNNFFVLVFASSGVVFSVMYTITMLNKVIFGNVKVSYFTR
jgi:NADH-quinone oxidoreductase subunit M